MGQLDKAGCNSSRVPGGSVWRDCFLFLTRVATTLPSETTKFKPVPPQLRRLEPAPANPNRQAVPPFLNPNLHRILPVRLYNEDTQRECRRQSAGSHLRIA